MSNNPAQQRSPQVKSSEIQVGGDAIGFNKIDYSQMLAVESEAPPLAGGDEAEVVQTPPAPVAPAAAPVAEAQAQLLQTIDRYFDLVAEVLDENPELQEESLERLQSAKEILQLNEGGDMAWTLSRAQFEVRRVHVAIAKEQQAQRSEGTLRFVVPGIVFLYTAAIIAVVGWGGASWKITVDTVLFGVPVPVLVWAIIGSNTAILYRFYTGERASTSTGEIRWLIARPFIGVIMGALTYLAIVSGLAIFGAAPSGEQPDISRPELMYVIAFLGGFSDRFYEAIISAVVGRFSQGGAGQPEGGQPAG